MRLGVSLLGGRTIPFHGFCCVLLHSDTIVIELAQVVLRLGISLLGGRTIPFHGFRRILLDADAIVVAHAQVV